MSAHLFQPQSGTECCGICGEPRSFHPSPTIPGEAMTPTQDRAVGEAELFTPPFSVFESPTTGHFRVIDSKDYGASPAFADPLYAQWLCDRLNAAPAPVVDEREAFERSTGESREMLRLAENGDYRYSWFQQQWRGFQAGAAWQARAAHPTAGDARVREAFEAAAVICEKIRDGYGPPVSFDISYGVADECARAIREASSTPTAPGDGLTDRYVLGKALAKLDGVALVEIKSTVGNPDNANAWRKYLGRADDLTASLTHPPSADGGETDREKETK